MHEQRNSPSSLPDPIVCHCETEYGSTAGGTYVAVVISCTVSVFLYTIYALGSCMHGAGLLFCGPGALAEQCPCWCESLRPAPIHPRSGSVDPIVFCVTTRRPANKGRLAPSLNIAAN